MRKGDSSPIDKHVGSRVRMRRLMLDMSQTELAKALGLKFQQVRRYEKGMDRVGASRLQHLSQILNVPVAFFFEGLPEGPERWKRPRGQLSCFPTSNFAPPPRGWLWQNRSLIFGPRNYATRLSCLFNRSRQKPLETPPRAHLEGFELNAQGQEPSQPRDGAGARASVTTWQFQERQTSR